MEILKENGYFGMIVSNKWLRAGYGAKLRKFLSGFWIEEFVDFGDLKVFTDATIYPSIIFARKLNKLNEKIRICKLDSLPPQTMDAYIDRHFYSISQNPLSDEEWILQRKEVEFLLKKLRSSGVPLVQFVGSKIYYGIKTGFNEAFIIDGKLKETLFTLTPRIFSE